jgi:hypothetical protein
MKIPETYEEFLKTPKSDLLEISKIDIPLEVASGMMTFICEADEEIRQKLIVESKRKKKNETIWEDLYGELNYEDT